ncbi:lysophospholipase L1-like esterase [Chthoniobacter flavus]|uniref:rhamnogalacturonan acetylesterase n=1 Tax=Chthoniobacter flavus TaxID=191863 RepID=UPI00104B36B3|nr:rhamnogalacturonan acetylesterase [Chthoniobacter flavus]TCO89397.1 lysophospholipase L1-like esterase [Chthoniobacter flavus]
MSRRVFLITLFLICCASVALAAEPASKADHKLRVVLVGDSTVAEKSGWGTAFIKLLAPDVECINAARGGQSSKSFLDGGNWKKALDLKPDWVLIQFGHNDQPGKGPNRETDPETTYRANLIRYVDEARAIGAKPVLVTSLVRRTFQPDKQHLRVDLEPYVAAMKKVAEEKHVPLVDLHARSKELVEKLGPEGVKPMEPEGKTPGSLDGTHLNERGGEMIAPLVADELRKVAPELATHLAK